MPASSTPPTSSSTPANSPSFPPVDLAVLKQRQRAIWGSGDYAVVGNKLQLVGELVCEAANLHAGWTVLDVAAGSGNASLAAARRGCRVTATDYVPVLLQRAQRRAEADGFTITFREADAEELPFPDARFDAVLSTFGVMFAPDQPRAAAQLLRVCKPGGVIALASWTPAGFVGCILKTIGKYVPPPANLKPSTLWGTEERLRELFPEPVEIETTKRLFPFRALSPEAWFQEFCTHYGPMLKAFSSLDGQGQASLRQDMLDLCAERNISGDSTLIVPSEYLEATIRRHADTPDRATAA